jgi:hypothetical protein
VLNGGPSLKALNLKMQIELLAEREERSENGRMGKK